MIINDIKPEPTLQVLRKYSPNIDFIFVIDRRKNIVFILIIKHYKIIIMQTNPFSVDVKSANTSSELEINNSNFFTTESNKQGYFEQSEFIDYGTTMRPREIDGITGLFNEMNKGTKMDYNLGILIDRQGRRYVYPKFFYPRAIKGYKVLVTDGILRLINDYVEGKIRVTVSARELAQHALSNI